MARKIVNRKEKRAELEAAERSGVAAEKTEKKTAKDSKAPKKPRATKRVVETRVRLFWGVFNQSMKRVALYEFNQKKQADKKAEDLTKSAKTQHFVQRVKEAIQD